MCKETRIPESDGPIWQTAMIEDPQVVEKYTKLDKLAAECINSSEQIPPPVIIKFTPGIYIRECHLEKDGIYITKIHNSTHPFFISRGSFSVSTDGENFDLIEAPYMGITTPGTQRIIIAHEDTIFTTIHANPDEERDLQKIEDRIMKKYEVPQELLSGAQNIQIQ
jgi:hypothetical protein